MPTSTYNCSLATLTVIIHATRQLPVSGVGDDAPQQHTDYACSHEDGCHQRFNAACMAQRLRMLDDRQS